MQGSFRPVLGPGYRITRSAADSSPSKVRLQGIPQKPKSATATRPVCETRIPPPKAPTPDSAKPGIVDSLLVPFDDPEADRALLVRCFRVLFLLDQTQYE